MKHTRRKGDISSRERLRRLRHINLKLSMLKQPVSSVGDDPEIQEIFDDLIHTQQQQRDPLKTHRCPADRRIEAFVGTYLECHGEQCPTSVPDETFVLDRAGLACELSLPPDGHHHLSEYAESYRIPQGVLHNPRNDRRTTKGVFHIVEGGLPVPGDKRAVPVIAFARLLEHALNPPANLLRLPYTAGETKQAELWVSLYLRPKVIPRVPDVSPERTMETRFFAPGALVSNLDFVERIFGNAGDPFRLEEDAGLDVAHWCGTTGCVILAPHLTKLTKRELGLPSRAEATERQCRDGMCWSHGEELYNDGLPFKLVCRDETGVIYTLIADNYFGYSKKEIKSQISFSANLVGGCEEEHAGGAIAFPTYNLGEYYIPDPNHPAKGYTFAEVVDHLGDAIDVKPAGYAIDRKFSSIVYVPEMARFDMNERAITWPRDNGEARIKLLSDHTYVLPSGFKIRMEKHPQAPTWRLVGTDPEGTFCHKPCTVSGGGKSEISKSISGAVISGPLYIGDFREDLDQVEAIFQHDYSGRFLDSTVVDTRSLLSSQRSLGSVIRLLTPSQSQYSEEYNNWLRSVPQHILALVYMVKRFYRPEWKRNWRRHFSVDRVNGHPGHEFKFDGRRLAASYLRVGLQRDGSWRTFKLRQDYVPSDKVQTEDDISVSTVLPATALSNLNSRYSNPSVKLVDNCELKLFQRPDDAVERGADLQAETDLSRRHTFISNFEPLRRSDATEILEDVVNLTEYTAPMRKFLKSLAKRHDFEYFVASDHPRLVDGKPSKNMRYLQDRPDHIDPTPRYLAEVGTRLHRRIPNPRSVFFPVNAVLPGRRNNPPDPASGIRPLSVYSPIHYQELPELFMDFVASLSGKSPSTTGAGSEGALTKGPFNALSTTTDLNNALVSMILCGYDGFTTPAGYIGGCRIDHDISLLMPEVWCRIPVEERDPAYLIRKGYLEKLEDFEYEGKKILASRLGYRITEQFAHAYLGKVFDSPNAVFDDELLTPETRDPDAFVDGVEHIVEAQRDVARQFLSDGSVGDACPPLQALLAIMAEGHHQGISAADPAFRKLFTLDYLLGSTWYQERLDIMQQREIALWSRHVSYLHRKITEYPDRSHGPVDLTERLHFAEQELARVRNPMYREKLQGSLGADWLHRNLKQAVFGHHVPVVHRVKRETVTTA
ncbi:MAG: hypothetical protein U9R74_03590 [Pseudomonadota bacterium]|nr:hypothetical protein [Pseudomonadota bacterium]